MATLASSLLDMPVSPAAAPRVALTGVPAASPVETIHERCVYAPSRRSGPVAFMASAGVMLAVAAALTTLSIAAQTKSSRHLTVVAMKELDTTPPPPPPAPKQLEEPVAPPQAFIPKPMIQLPAPGPTQVAIEAPPPPPAAPVVVVKPAAVTAAKPAATSASTEPANGGDLSSQVLSAKPPTYPIEARRQKLQGTVKLLLLVGPDGRVSDIQVSGSSGSIALDKAALAAVRRWRWKPQQQNGAPVAVRGYVTIPFVLV